ncbi:hypothetical protein ACN28C_31275 [Plantactinospora sp. WMMC1484]|uniref:hypothetical protein n=1 Tax=Plantactinospora sp. WMMC1484 TaxID=3404122 RepID=UPI003BF4DE07
MSDMRQLLEIAKSDSPPARMTVDDIVVSGRRRVRRRRLGRSAGAVGGASMAVAALVLATTALLPEGSGPGDAAAVGGPVAGQQGADAAASGFAHTFTGYELGDYRVVDSMQVTSGYQSTAIERSNLDVGDGPAITVHAGTLTVYRPGVFRPERFSSGSRVVVQGREGYATTLGVQMRFGDAGTDADGRRTLRTETVQLPALAWQYADGAWATIESDNIGERGVPAQIQQQLAERFAVGQPTQARLPYRASYLPAGWQLVSAGRSLVPGDTAVALAQYARQAPDFGSLTTRVDLDDPETPYLRVSVAPVETEGPYAHPVTPPCSTEGHFCDVKIDSRYYAEVQDQSGTLSTDEIKKIAEGLEFADPAEPSGWYPVAGR